MNGSNKVIYSIEFFIVVYLIEFVFQFKGFIIQLRHFRIHQLLS